MTASAEKSTGYTGSSAPMRTASPAKDEPGGGAPAVDNSAESAADNSEIGRKLVEEVAVMVAPEFKDRGLTPEHARAAARRAWRDVWPQAFPIGAGNDDAEQIARLRNELAAETSMRGLLVVDSSPAGAEVMVNRRPEGTTRAEVWPRAGRHKVTLSLKGHETETFDVEIQPLKKTEVAKDLKKSP